MHTYIDICTPAPLNHPLHHRGVGEKSLRWTGTSGDGGWVPWGSLVSRRERLWILREMATETIRTMATGDFLGRTQMDVCMC